jgi:ligand-binding sensor domain-containing protein
MRIPLVVSLTPLALALACSDQGPIQGVAPKLTISPERVSVETGADPITLQAVPQNGDLTGNVTWEVFTGNAGSLGASNGQTVSFTPTGLGTPGGPVVIKATAIVGGTLQPATAEVRVIPSTHGRIVLGIDPGDAVGSVDITDPGDGSKTTFVADAPTVVRSKIIDAGTYTVTADAGIAITGNLVDGIWDGAVRFDGGTPARSVQVPVRPNAETTVAVTFALRGGQGRLWMPVDGAIRSFTESQLLGDHASENGISVGGIRALAFDADGNLWATFSGGIQMFTPETQAGDLSTPARTVTLADATGIAIRGDTVAVATCNGSSGGVSTFSRSDVNATPAPLPISVGCIWGISYDVGDNGKLWVASKNQGKVYRFNAAGTASDFPSAPSVSDAYGLAVDSGGSAWVTSCSGNSVVEISPAGEAGSPLSLPDFSCPGGVAFDKQESLWVVSEGTQDNGNLIQVAGGNGTVQLNSLTQVTFGGVAFNPGAAGLPTHQ